MQFELPFGPARRHALNAREDWLRVGSRHVRLWLVPNRRARRYVLRLRPDGTARVAIPRGGSAAEAKRFAEKNTSWLEQQLLRQATRPSRPRAWTAGSEILFRGEPVQLEACVNGEARLVRFGTEVVRVKDPAGDLRFEVERHLRQLAEHELSELVPQLAALHQVSVLRVSVRNQRSRWGSYSRRGTVSLNWRLVQTPLFVRDYIVLHEFAHFKEMNHSRRFWREVERLCPDFLQAESWLKRNGDLLR
jgi:predicted metal-dependent hydrolase